VSDALVPNCWRSAATTSASAHARAPRSDNFMKTSADWSIRPIRCRCEKKTRASSRRTSICELLLPSQRQTGAGSGARSVRSAAALDAQCDGSFARPVLRGAGYRAGCASSTPTSFGGRPTAVTSATSLVAVSYPDVSLCRAQMAGPGALYAVAHGASATGVGFMWLRTWPWQPWRDSLGLCLESGACTLLWWDGTERVTRSCCPWSRRSRLA